MQTTPEVAVQGAEFVPFSKPVLPSNCVGVPPAVVMVSAMVTVWVRFPEVPVTVTLAEEAVAVLLAVKVSWLVVVVLAGLNDAVTPAGSPLAVRLTAPVNPFSDFTVMVLFPLAPAAILRLVGAAESE